MRVRMIVAAVLAVVGVLFAVVVLQSPSVVLWTGERADGYSEGGLTYYAYQGNSYTVNNPGQPSYDRARVPTTVYFPADDPGNARQDGAVRWIDATSVLVWFVAAAVVLLTGLRRRAVRRRV